ncbi:DUF2489 domain-containing protein [Pseudidiomarina donghaiensis]|uniref:DUF2489 domain-containing protein n=1 Tax=Pseudidiomarina donghaiensis TaxID=519452 RepID=A0A432XGV3_9GAMM|nr:DUF2489 domain-containing protein [Pseudidiomarina donghaiensis]RUO47984.1 DUF2489 domain-containing protein [Pseudidiomarina donghaiensis]SFV22732.1 Protein of unknown function [Pseudidiomarina donghaiensis]
MTDSSLPLWAWIAAVVGIVIICALAFYAGRLLGQLKQQNQRRDYALAKRNENLHESIVTIAKAMDQGQCPLSEGALRLVVLLDLRVESNEAKYATRYPALHDMYERIKHMPTHEARKQYPKQEIRKMDSEREGYEQELEDVILQDVRQLLKDFG